MTIKVVSFKQYTCTCRKCGSKLEYEYRDLYLRKFTDYAGESEHYNVVDCPVCLTPVIPIQ